MGAKELFKKLFKKEEKLDLKKIRELEEKGIRIYSPPSLTSEDLNKEGEE